MAYWSLGCSFTNHFHRRLFCLRTDSTDYHLDHFFSAVSVLERPFVKRFNLCYRTVVLCLSVLSCLSVTLVHCGQTVGWSKMKLGMQVGLGHGHTVLDGDPAPPPPKGQSPPISGPYLLRPNGWMDQDATWHGGRPQPSRLCVRWGPSTPPLQKGGGAPSPTFGTFLLWPNGWMHQDVTWYGASAQGTLC